MAAHREKVAAIVNGLLVLLSPLVISVVGANLTTDSNASVTVRPPDAPPIIFATQTLIWIGQVLLPFALLAGWRTWVYTIRYLEAGDRGWRGVAEAGACGLIVALLYLSPGIVTRPMEAPPYVIVYGGGALIVGVVVGLVLRASALLVLKLQSFARA
jgi:hypothetical protein